MNIYNKLALATLLVVPMAQYGMQADAVQNAMTEADAKQKNLDAQLCTLFWAREGLTSQQRTRKILHLLSQGAQINESDFDHATPLYYAIMDRDFTNIQLLVKKGAEINHINQDDGSTPLLSLVSQMVFDVTHARATNMQCFEQRMDILRYLLSKGGNVRDAFQVKLLNENVRRHGYLDNLSSNKYSAQTIVEYIKKHYRYDSKNKELQQTIDLLQKYMDAQDLEKKNQ